MLEVIFRTDQILGPLLTTFLLGFTTLFLLFWYSHRKQSYWRDRGISYAKPFPILGSTLEVLKKPLHEIEVDRYKKYGRLYGHYEGNQALLSVGEPELLKHILVKDFHAFTGRRNVAVNHKVLDKMLTAVRGEDWKRIRTIVTPTFTTGRIKRMISIFKESAETVVQNIKEATINGKTIEAKRLYGAFTMDIIASSAFSTKIDSHNDPDNPFVRNARKVFSRNLTWKFVIFLTFPKLIKLFKVKLFDKEVVEFFTNVSLQIIEERKKTGQTRNDFLQLLLDTSKESFASFEADRTDKIDIAENYGEEDNSMFKENAYTKKTLSYEEVIAQCLIFFLAGYDTTASTLSFASYNLALNPDIQEKLIQEIDDVLRENNGEVTYEAVQNMKYLDNVISETLRLYPPLTRLERLADENYTLKNIGLTIPKGMLVSIPVYAMHRDPKLYPDPEKFDPDRFTPEERAKRDPYVYMPFGLGPRNCVAMRFALMEIKVCLAHVLSNFRIRKCPQTKVPLDFYIGQALLQPKEITLSFQARSDAVKTTQES